MARKLSLEKTCKYRTLKSTKRCFVLQPLHEIAADLHIPTKGKIRDLAHHCKKHEVRRIGPTKPLATRKNSPDLHTIQRRKAIATRMRFIFNMNQKSTNVCYSPPHCGNAESCQKTDA